ncbi:MAG: acyltransferase [Chloroflexota bacterium]|nr:acyltransferase [Chloroflexota bacterium]
MEYRREIDGLRALAVLPVILFHAGFETFSGGFVGVDVFFVISGYLITTIILAELAQGKFSLVNFYERRARRILPALFLVMLVCIPLAWFWLLPSDMKGFYQSLVAVSVFASNILFWRESGYFDTAAELKPLLHTWSLAVEEQYYVLFPLFLMLTWRFGKRWTLVLLATVGFTSLAMAQWASIAKPAAAFYLLPTRGWELSVGAFAAFYLSSVKRGEFGKGLREFGACLGLTLILYSVFAYSEDTPFPGLYALVPTIGTVLIILFATQQTRIGKFVGNRVFVGIGLISYSAYLWHYPLFAFARNRSPSELSGLFFAILSIASLVLAYLSWRYVEGPFRNKVKFSRIHIFNLAFVASMFFISLGLFGSTYDGIEPLLDENPPQLISYNTYNFKDIYRQGDCFLNAEQSFEEFKPECLSPRPEKSILIWGDSHAAALSFGFRNKYSNVIQYTAGGCPPLLGVSVSWRPMCEGINNFIAEQVKQHKPSEILLHANWLLYEEQKPLVSIKNTIDYIRVHSPHSRITIVGGVPQYRPSLPSLMMSKGLRLDNGIYLESHSYRNLSRLDREFIVFSQEHGTEFFSALSAFCDGNNCQVTSEYDGVIMPTAWDYGHLTTAGSVFLMSRFRQLQQPQH